MLYSILNCFVFHLLYKMENTDLVYWVVSIKDLYQIKLT